jgi:lipopolysaccharide/colanic/teichoic acid biosynthesis glycosyltransferase
LFLNTDGRDPAAVWGCVEGEIRAGRAVWLAGALVRALARRFGADREGGCWIKIAPHADSPAWLYRARDVVLSAAALIVLTPLFALLALLVKLDSPGPVFYSATVIGKEKRPFRWLKFRSMYVDKQMEDEAERPGKFRAFVESNRQGKVIDRTRVTRVGGMLRKYSLDELPQLWNVLKGEMSLVGPRPCLGYELEMFPVWAVKRFHIKPGLTGVWQIVGRSRVSFNEGLGMDMYYFYGRSFGEDLRLMIQTVGVMVRGVGGE